MAAPTPNATYNRVGTSLLFNTSYSVASGKALFVVANTVFINPSTPTGWTLVRTGSNFKLFTRTANGTSTDNFGNAFYGTGLVFDSGVTEDYTSGTWDNTSSVAPAPNGGSALSSSTDELVVVSFHSVGSYSFYTAQGPTDATPATTSGFTGGTSVTDAQVGTYYEYYYGFLDAYTTEDQAVQVQYKALSTTTPGTTTWGTAFNGTDNGGGSYYFADAGRDYPFNDFYSATLAFKAASSGSAYTASASGTATASGTASLTKSLTGSATGTETATGTGAITYTANSTASSSITANGTGALTATYKTSATSTITGTGTADTTQTSVSSKTIFVDRATVSPNVSVTMTHTKGLQTTGTITGTGTAEATIKYKYTTSASGNINALGYANLTATTLTTITASDVVTATGSATLGITAYYLLSPIREIAPLSYDPYAEIVGYRLAKTVVKKDGVWLTVQNRRKSYLDSCTVVLYGGHENRVTASQKTELEAAGYTVQTRII